MRELALSYWVKHTDWDAEIQRFYGPMCKTDAEEKAAHLNRVPGHSAEIVQPARS